MRIASAMPPSRSTAHRHLRRRSARSSGWRWSSPGPRARLPQTADDEAACTAASRRVRCYPARRLDSPTFGGRNDDGARDGSEKRSLLRRELTISRARPKITHHQRERLFFPVFAFAKGLDRGGVARVTGQVVPAEPFDGDDLPVGRSSAALRTLSSLPRTTSLPA